jgi:hypothetical protein
MLGSKLQFPLNDRLLEQLIKPERARLSLGFTIWRQADARHELIKADFDWLKYHRTTAES